MMKTERSFLQPAFEPRDGDDMIICRCEEITRGEIRRAVFDGMRTLPEIRRYLRAGMGLCQGQTCGLLVRGIVAQELGVRPDTLNYATPRTPARLVEMSVYANEVTGNE